MENLLLFLLEVQTKQHINYSHVTPEPHQQTDGVQNNIDDIFDTAHGNRY